MPTLSDTTEHMPEDTPHRRLAWLTGLGLLTLLAWDFSGLDLRTMQEIATPEGFGLRHNWWLAYLLHDQARRAAMLIYLAVLAMVWLPMGRLRDLTRLQRLEIWAGITLGLVVVNVVKRYSLTSCPWDLNAFGGTATYVSHWDWGLRDGGSGHCFPGGHASSAFAFIALSLPWLVSPSAADRRFGVRLLGGILVLGAFLGTVQTLRGAHYPSHTMWTGFLCWVTAALNHMGFTWWGTRTRPIG